MVIEVDVLYSHVYIYDHASRCTHHPSQSDPRVPWPVVWLLGRYNRKHIFCGRRLPPMTFLRKSLQDFRRGKSGSERWEEKI